MYMHQLHVSSGSPHIMPCMSLVGASLSEPHINGKPMHNPYIVVRRSYLLRIAVRSPVEMRNNTPCAMTYAAEKRTWTSLVPRPYPAFQCCTLKNGRAWYLKSRARARLLHNKHLEKGRQTNHLVSAYGAFWLVVERLPTD